MAFFSAGHNFQPGHGGGSSIPADIDFRNYKLLFRNLLGDSGGSEAGMEVCIGDFELSGSIGINGRRRFFPSGIEEEVRKERKGEDYCVLLFKQDPTALGLQVLELGERRYLENCSKEVLAILGHSGVERT